MERTILHCDMNNFYASVECFLNPKLKPYPVAVCGSAEERRGIVLAKNLPAKQYGIETAETVYSAKKKCPHLVILPPHYDLYSGWNKSSTDAKKLFASQCRIVLSAMCAPPFDCFLHTYFYHRRSKKSSLPSIT